VRNRGGEVRVQCQTKEAARVKVGIVSRSVDNGRGVKERRGTAGMSGNKTKTEWGVQ